ncbi:efflux RND transporter periplasmic adaptor subunit [Caulobacter sp. BE254]|uniref:efflux RND transporter periplasmic adaptor subunit n=1 Tax=Caulobacter sp. BE254 TaxID=2817720 RepID=UPI0028610096|nr:efflux RND transporter periplasmic adaptor subunit [Caulobacter sp. BE254]MDR7118182.1 RND family efflux transporter MFP subunit [Caulobacter sp. BE254]
MVLCIGVLGLTACDHGDKAKAKTPKPSLTASQTVSVAPVTIQSLPRIINASGTVTPWEEVPVGAETGGLTAVSVNAEEGQTVRQGQILVALNDTMLRAQLHQQEAAVASAKATLAEAQAALGRSRELQAKGYLSQSSLDTATARQQTAAAQLASADASRNETIARLGQAAIRAPVSGLISRRSVTKGQIVTAGTELFRIVRDGRLELDAEIPEADLLSVKAGMPATVSSDQVGRTTGTVRIVTSEVNAQTRVGLARISLAPGGGFRSGMFARAQIAAGNRPAPTIPTAAILYRQNQPGVFVVDASNHARFRRIDILARNTDQTSAEGLNAGERVVVEGAGFLGDNDAVRIAGAPAPRTAPAVAANR